ncbi:MAG: leucine-rich repeat domain-containing protein [Candidatus Thiodiazotropha sp. (ex Lucina pensylvanica)]|nr:leucine-rich repeat domain-containing protein [Candidatus Thiodiazotropha sp. (ex Lucina pensylvanica)]
MPDIKLLRGNPWPDVNWGETAKPAIIVDGALYSLKDLEDRFIEGDSAYIVGSNEKNIGHICSRINPRLIQFYEMRVSDLSVTQSFTRLTHLAIRWNTKVADLGPLERHKNLEVLIIEDTPKIASIAPLANLQSLRYLDYSGGIWNKNRAETLAPISKLRQLEYLALNNIRVDDGSLKPIVQCQKIKELHICNKFKTEEFAYLAANMPNVECNMFQAYIKLGQSIGGDDVMVVGSRKPFLSSAKDGERLKKYEANFSKLVKKFSE